MVSTILCSFLLVGLWTGIIVSPSGKIVGGSDAGDGKYPHQVSLRSDGHFCGGSIIGKNWILTAAHCFIGIDVSQMTVVVGTNYLNSGGTVYFVASVIVHEYYNPQGTANDIALIEVTKNIVTSNTVKIITLANSLPQDGAICDLSGWGYTSWPSQVLPNNLQHIRLYKISLEECQLNLPNYPIYYANVCTFKAPGKGGCKGDSGGPLISGNVQIGIVSWGIPCALGVPDVFTSVPSYRQWIKYKTGI